MLGEGVGHDDDRNKRHVGPSSCTESEWVDGWAVVLVVLGGVVGGGCGGGWRCGSFGVCFVCCVLFVSACDRRV